VKRIDYGKYVASRMPSTRDTFLFGTGKFYKHKVMLAHDRRRNW
jgi:hypothetical protein